MPGQQILNTSQNEHVQRTSNANNQVETAEIKWKGGEVKEKLTQCKRKGYKRNEAKIDVDRSA